MNLRKLTTVALLGSLLLVGGCRENIFQSPTVAPVTMRDVPALRLNYRYEPDVPAPTDDKKNAPTEERNAAVQADFDQNRPQEMLDRTILSPDKKRVLAVYHRVSDAQAEFRLDMYAPDGKLLRKITPDSMAVHFPDTILWSPDSANVAFVAMIRAGTAGAIPSASPNANANTGANTNANTNSANANAANVNANVETNANAETPNAETNANAGLPPAPMPSAPTGVLTFRTEQIYVCNSEGDGIKPITQNEGLIYFYYVWSPDGSMLASLAATYREWQFLQYQADSKGESFQPLGRPRLVETNGRERRLDDALTQVRPVWSPDSSKVAVGFDKQVRIYDAIGNNPTQAAIPLRNPLLTSSQVYDQQLIQKENANAQSAPANADTQGATVLPDESQLVSFNPIILLEWTADDLLYFQTGYVKLMKNDAESVRSYLRWHRLILSPQAVSLGR